MTEQHPIAPPPELVERLRKEAPHGIRHAGVAREIHLITAAYSAGADQGLEACRSLLDINGCPGEWIELLRNALRPKQPSLAEEALEAWETEDDLMPFKSSERAERFDLIRRALERLQELEGQGD